MKSPLQLWREWAEKDPFLKEATLFLAIGVAGMIFASL